MKHHLWYLLFLVLLTCVGCAQQKDIGIVQDLPVEAVEEPGDAMDMMLADDFYDEDDNALCEAHTFNDPLEPINRFFFEFNDKLYYWFLKPVNKAYTAVLPIELRFSFGNFVVNLSAPIRFLNNLLQGKVYDAGIVLSRFLINSTLGVYGFGDPALVDFGLEPKPEDFGQTLAVWGVGEGVYLCLPVIGPSNVRDSFGFAADAYTHPMVYFVDDIWVSAGYYAGSRINLLSLNPDLYEDLKAYALDPYVSMRQVYLDSRRNRVDDLKLKQRCDNDFK
ncbi:MAG: VacJ family lipoprotein [Desulfocapsa sp.]|nr:VacJ family lipoprotein [Desulfocapsa sp.]